MTGSAASMPESRAPDSAHKTADLIAACDRICGVKSNYHKDRCPLYKANCAAMEAMNHG